MKELKTAKVRIDGEDYTVSATTNECLIDAIEQLMKSVKIKKEQDEGSITE